MKPLRGRPKEGAGAADCAVGDVEPMSPLGEPVRSAGVHQ